ncbi:hypothetical protein [Pasteuria penetrans]|nr:hypothetical protein [Pasteuria penetrans]
MDGRIRGYLLCPSGMGCTGRINTGFSCATGESVVKVPSGC